MKYYIIYVIIIFINGDEWKGNLIVWFGNFIFTLTPETKEK